MIVDNPLPAKNVKELVALAKSRPGQLPYASAGNGSPQHLAGELLKSMAGVDMVHVPYKGSGPALISVLGGEVDFLIPGLPECIMHIKSGKLRALKQPEVAQRVREQGLTLVANAPDAAHAFMAAEVTRWGKLVREANVKPDS